jgi:hypothetical protein
MMKVLTHEKQGHVGEGISLPAMSQQHLRRLRRFDSFWTNQIIRISNVQAFDDKEMPKLEINIRG